MITRQLTLRQYQSLCEALKKKAHAEPMTTIYTATVFINSREYSIKLLPHKKHQITMLEALLLDRGDDFTVSHILITDPGLLLSFLNLLVYQGL